MRYGIFILIFLLNFLSGKGQKNSPDKEKIKKDTSVEMDEVVITATRFLSKIKETPVLTEVISSAELNNSGSTEIATAISNTNPGLEFYNQGSGMTFGMQGIGSKYTLFLIDGERMAGENHDNIDYYRLTTSTIEKVEIMKGASSALYGSNAMGGVINLISRVPVKPFEANVYGRYSKYNELESGANMGFATKKLSSFSDFSRKSSSGYDLTPETPDLYTLEPFELYHAFQKFTYRPTDKLSFALKGSYYSRERFDVAEIPVHPLYHDHYGSLSAEYRINSHFVLNATYHTDHYNSYQILERLNDQKESIYYDLQNTGRITGKYSQEYKKIIENQSVIAGMEVITEKMFSERIQDSTRTIINMNFFVLDEVKINKYFSAIGGLRYDDYSTLRSSCSPTAALMYSNGRFNYRATYSQGFRAPSIKEQYYNFDLGFIFVKGNSSLRPEHSKYFSLSAEYAHKKNNASVNIYYNRVDDMIHDVLLANTTNGYTYINLNTVNVAGIDYLHHFSITKNWSVNGGYSYTNAYDLTNRSELSGVSKNSGVAGMDFKWMKNNYKIIFSVSGKIYSKKTFDNYNASTSSFYKDTYPSYSLWRASVIQYFFNKSIELNAGITNIFNYKKNMDLINIDPGRRLFCMLNISIDKLTEIYKSKKHKS